MKSDFLIIRALLECAIKRLHGSDEISLRMREAIELLIDAAIVAEQNGRASNIISFDRERNSRVNN